MVELRSLATAKNGARFEDCCRCIVLFKGEKIVPPRGLGERTRRKLTPWDFVHAVGMTIACGVAYAIITHILSRVVDRPTDLLGGMWAVIATIFVFRESREDSLCAGVSRLVATGVSFALCLGYLTMFPFRPLGMVIVIGIGTIIMTLLGRSEDIITTGITTAVVLVVAGITPEDAWQQPLLRLIDTVVGIGVGVSFKWFASYAYSRIIGGPDQ